MAHGKRRAELQCRACHIATRGVDITVGIGRVVPRIDGQNYSYLVKQLCDFKTLRGNNDGGVMGAIVKTLSDRNIEDLATYFFGGGSVAAPC